MAPPNLWRRVIGGLEKVFQPLPRKNEFWQTTCSLCLSLSTLTIHVPPCHPRTYSPPFLRETTLKFLPVTTCSSKSSFSGSCSVLSIRSRYGYPLPPNIEWWHINNHHSDSGKGRMENIVSHWSIGNLLHGNHDNFLPWQWRKSFGQILVLLSVWDFLILCLFILPLEGSLVHSLPWSPLNQATTNSFVCQHPTFRYLPGLDQLVQDMLLLKNPTMVY